MRGLVIAAPASGSGKTLLTLGLLRHFARQGIAVASAKAGPDYIDPAFHAAATSRPCFNLDSWAMRPGILDGLAARASDGADLVVLEGVMGLFDGAFVPPGEKDGSTAELAAHLGWPVVLVVDARAMAGSAAALVKGFAAYRPDVRIAGVIFNKVGGPGHERILRESTLRACPDLAVLGCLPRQNDLEMPSRHLGLVQAGEYAALQAFLDRAADFVAAHLDLSALRDLAGATPELQASGAAVPLSPLGQRIAVARDQAFAFSYASVLEGWQAAGAELSFFSPLADQAPDPAADAVYLPGGYPELHAATLAANGSFLGGVRQAAAKGAPVFGECGGYMVLGQGLVDSDGRRHAMAGLLPLETSFAQRRLHLGYRRASLTQDCPLGRAGECFRGHEFHYATTLSGGAEKNIFALQNAAGEHLGEAGLREGPVFGSFLHLIDRSF